MRIHKRLDGGSRASKEEREVNDIKAEDWEDTEGGQTREGLGRKEVSST